MLQEMLKLYRPKTQLEWKVFRASVTLLTLPYITYASIAGMLWVTLSLRWKWGRSSLDAVTHRWLLVIAGLLLVSCGFAVDRAEAMLQLANFLPFLFFFAVLPFLLKTTEHLEKIALNLLIASVPLNAIAFFEYLVRNLTLPPALRRLPLIRWMRARPHSGRAMVFFEHPNWLANFLVLIFGLGLGLIWRYTLRAKQQKIDSGIVTTAADSINPNPIRSKSIVRSLPLALLYIATFLNLVGIFSSGSRNGLIVAISQLILFTLLVKADRRILIAGLLGLLGLGTGATLFGIGGRSVSLATWLNDPRIRQWKIAIDLALDRPWWGWGLGNYKFEMPERLLTLDPSCSWQRAYTRPIPVLCEFVTHPHNVWLLLASEAGIIVTLLFTGLIGMVCFRAVRLFFSSRLEAIDRAILLAYLLSFWGCTTFGLFDVTLYDARINVINWIVLAGLYQINRKVIPD